MVYQKQLVVVLAPAKLNLSLDVAGLLRMATARGFFFLMMKQMGARCCFYVG